MLGPEVYRAALRPHQDDQLSAQALAALWKRFCRSRRGALQDGWKWAWRDRVDDECRTVALFRRRPEKTMAVIAKGKAAAEAALGRALTPERQAVEREAENAVHWARYRVEDKRRVLRNTIIANGPKPERQAAGEALRLAEAEVVRLEAAYERIVEDHRRETYKRIGEDRQRRECERQRAEREAPPGSWLAERRRHEAEAKRFRSLSRKQREVSIGAQI